MVVFPIFMKKYFMLLDRYVGINFDALQICPQFSDFEFTNWDRDSQVGNFMISLLNAVIWFDKQFPSPIRSQSTIQV